MPCYETDNENFESDYDMIYTDNETFGAKYHITDEVLGNGMYGNIRSVINKFTGEKFALKTVEMLKDRIWENLEAEIEVLCLVKGNDNFVQIIDYYCENNIIYIVMENLKQGSLAKYIVTYGEFGDPEAATVVKDMARALSFLHKFEISHRDIKLANIMLSNEGLSSFKLIDFGFSTGSIRPPCCPNHGNDIFSRPVGTPTYIAPEVANIFLKDTGHYNKQCDMWSLGVVLYEILFAHKPFMWNGMCTCTDGFCTDCNKVLLETIIGGDYKKPDKWNVISEGAKDMLLKLLEKDPNERYTPDQVLQHPWIKKYF